MPFSNSIWGACCFKSSSGHHESSSIEFRVCFQHYFIFNPSWTSFHLLSPLRCFLQPKDTSDVPWSHAVGVVCAYFSLILVCHWIKPCQGCWQLAERPQEETVCTQGEWLLFPSPLTGLLYISTMSCFTPCRVGWAHGDGFAQCRFKSKPIREHLCTHRQKEQQYIYGLLTLLASDVELSFIQPPSPSQHRCSLSPSPSTSWPHECGKGVWHLPVPGDPHLCPVAAGDPQLQGWRAFPGLYFALSQALTQQSC